MITMKQITLLILIISLNTKIFAQENKLNIGIEGSPNLIYLRGDALDKRSRLSIGFSAGLSFQYNLSKVLSIRTNITYEKKGGNFLRNMSGPDAAIPFTVKQKTKFDYLTAPILLRASFGKKTKFFLNSGVFFGYLIKEKDTFTRPTAKLELEVFPSEDNTNSFKLFDTGISIGFGFSSPLKKKFLLSFEIRNNTGLYNIDKPYSGYSPTLKTSSTNLLIGLAYKFGVQSTETN
jgi:hypothetical protein